MKKNCWFVVFATILMLSSVLSTGSLINENRGYSSKSTKSIYVDCSEGMGQIKCLQGINCGPIIHMESEGADLTEQYQDIGIEMVRTHDFGGPTDWNEIFPNWDADVENENSYNFASSDKVISSIINADCKVFYRLGISWPGDKSLAIPPKNFTKWAEICKHIVMHYNDGWANGFHYDITYWEIWNEPDLRIFGSGIFWEGTPEDYYRLYKITAKTLKEYNSSLKIGGPAVSWVENLNYSSNFIRYVVENDLPLDFFSWHLYDKDPYNFYRTSSLVRKMLNESGLDETENILSEWNTELFGISPKEYGYARGAAFTACTMIFLQDARCDMAHRYRGTQWHNLLYGVALFKANGDYKKPAYAFKAMKTILETPNRIYTNEMDHNESFAFIAGASNDGKNITILMSNYDSKYGGYNLTIKNLPWENINFTYIRYLLDDFNDLKIVEIQNFNGSSFETYEEIPQETLHLIRLTTCEKIIPSVSIIKPRKGFICFFGWETIKTDFQKSIIFGKMNIQVNAYDEGGIDKVEFYIDDVLKDTVTESPYEWLWDETVFGNHEIKAIAYDNEGNDAKDKIEVKIFNIGG